MKRILFTGGGGAGNEAIFRLLGSRYDLHFADADQDNIDNTIPLDRRHEIPLARAEGFSDRVSQLCQTLKIDLLVPGVDEELLAMAELSRGNAFEVLVPEHFYVETMLDKFLTAKALLRAGLPAPQTVTADSDGSVGFPCMAKPRQGRGSRGVQRLESAAQCEAYLTLSGLPASEIIRQELLIGQEYTVLMAADRSARLHAIVPVKVSIKRGITILAETERSAQIIAACQTIHKALPARGLYNIQCMALPDGRVMVFEINPRISTTFCLAVAAGIDPLAIYLDNKAPDATLKTFEITRLRRHWRNDFLVMEK